ncbi:MAG: B12-binding domain-containing radical SAM protein [Barnesiella sp.]
MSFPKLLFITPPFTQFNTPYPATAYLKGYFGTLNVPCSQADLSLETILKLFSSEVLSGIFERAVSSMTVLPAHLKRMVRLRKEYVDTIDVAIAYLQGKEQSLAHMICSGDFLPESSRSGDEEDLEWAFGTMGIHDRARHLITLYLEDIADFIRETVEPNFGFTKYAEHLGRSASSFDAIQAELDKPSTLIDSLMYECLEAVLVRERPDWVMITVPFPGNLYSALRCGKFIKQHNPDIRIVLGGGFPSTELRELTDIRIFNYTDYIVLDDGELPLSRLIEYDGSDDSVLVRTYLCRNGKVLYFNDCDLEDIPQSEKGTPDYSGLFLDKYLSVIDMLNPMHSLWSNGRWNKLTLAHGCYWGKCAFCDGSLDYIGRYQPDKAACIVDRMEKLIADTGERGFHFVDEAAPPVLLKELAIEILRRGLKVVWWGNIRFEKSFTADLCRLLRESGCIAVSGGLEVASDRLLKLINKGVSLEQVSRVTAHFTESGIMVHAYLMYGFPTETVQETIDSLEVVRQLFMTGLVQSAFWHRFALTAHSPVGKHPEEYNIQITESPFCGFARNDLSFIDRTGTEHELFGEGLRCSLYNYMRGTGFDVPLQKWFDIPVPRTQIPPRLIERFLEGDVQDDSKNENKRLLWMYPYPEIRLVERKKKGKVFLSCEILLIDKKVEERFYLEKEWGKWLEKEIPYWMLSEDIPHTFGDMKRNFESFFPDEFERFLSTPLWKTIRRSYLVLI